MQPSPSPSPVVSPPGQVGGTIPGAPPPPALRRLPAAVGGASSVPAPAFPSPLFSLSGQKLGPRRVSSCSLPTEAETPRGRGGEEGWGVGWELAGGPGWSWARGPSWLVGT